ncbi:kinase-like domain-containing protein [Syncephalis fuscata]|nr:kinase-like domain-containing protein [Syncephalis fuscata]
MNSSNTEQSSISLSNASIYTPLSTPRVVAVASAGHSSGLLQNEDLMYTNVPNCWNALSAEKRASAVAWIQVCDLTSKEFVLAADKQFYAGPGICCDYQLDAEFQPQFCFQVSVAQHNDTITIANCGLPIVVVNDAEVRMDQAKTAIGNCVITIPGCTTVFNIHIVKRTPPAQLNDNSVLKQRIDMKYLIMEEILGKGGYGTVYLGRDRATRERVAIKVSPADEDTSSFDNEVEALEWVGSHSRIIKLLDSEVTPVNTYLILQYVAGGDLSHYLKHHASLPEMEIKHIFKQLLEGIQFLHSKDVIHRDIKPSNILLLGGCEGPNVLYADFGIAHILRSSTTVDTFGGTTPYMAPEVLFGTNKRESLLDIINEDSRLKNQLTPALLDVSGCGKAADMWSLGAVLYKMFFKTCPYGDGGDVEQYMKNILQASVPFGQEQTNGPSKKAVDLMQQLLNINSDKRPTAEQALACPWLTGEDLTPEAAEEPVATTSATATPIVVAPIVATIPPATATATAPSPSPPITTTTQAASGPTTKKQRLAPKLLQRRRLKRRCYSKYKSQGAAKRSIPLRKCRLNKGAY